MSTIQSNLLAKIRQLYSLSRDRDVLKTLELFELQVAEYITTTPKEAVGGILPVCVDPITFEPYFLFGIENIRASDCHGNKKNYFYEDPRTHRLAIRKAFCHFHGWVDCYETQQQGAAREGYEESRGLIGDQVDLWHCLSFREYHHVTEALRSLFLISLGYLNEVQRNSLVERFHGMKVTSIACEEVSRVHFLPINRLYECLQRFAVREIFGRCEGMNLNLSEVDPLLQPNDYYWLRAFVVRWFLKKKAIIPHQEEVLKQGAASTFPSMISIPLHPHPFALGTLTSRKTVKENLLKSRFVQCDLCNVKITEFDDIYTCVSCDIDVHAECVLKPEGESWRVLNEEQLFQSCKLSFFEDPLLHKLLHPDPSKACNEEIYPGFRSIYQLPNISPETKDLINRAFHLRDQYLPKDPRHAHDDRSYSERRKTKICGNCGETFFLPIEKDYRNCRSCAEIIKEVKERKSVRESKSNNRGEQKDG